MGRVVLVAACLVAALGIGLAVWQLEIREPTHGAEAQLHVPEDEEPDDSARQVRLLREEIAELKRRIADHPPRENRMPGPRDDELSAPRKNVTPRMRVEDLPANLELAFEAEGRGGEMAKAIEADIVKSSQSSFFSDSELLDVECRSQMCRVEVHHRTAEAKGRFMPILNTPPWSHGFVASEVPVSSGRYVFHVAIAPNLDLGRLAAAHLPDESD